MKLILSLCLLCVFALPADAERFVRAVYFKSPKGAPKVVHAFGLEGNPEMLLPRLNFGEAVRIPDGKVTLAFTPGPVPEDKLPSSEAPVVVIPESWSQAVILFFHDPANKFLPVKAKAVNASPKNFGPGDRYWINLSRAVVAPKIGKLKVPRIEPRTVHIMKSPGGAKRDVPVIVKCILPEDGKVRDLCRTTWRHDPASRKIVFVLPNPGRKVPRIWSIPFSDPPPKKND